MGGFGSPHLRLKFPPLLQAAALSGLLVYVGDIHDRREFMLASAEDVARESVTLVCKGDDPPLGFRKVHNEN